MFFHYSKGLPARPYPAFLLVETYASSVGIKKLPRLAFIIQVAQGMVISKRQEKEHDDGRRRDESGRSVQIVIG